VSEVDVGEQDVGAQDVGADVVRRDIRDEDLHETLTAFYAIIAVDGPLVRYFETVDMSVHMPRIVAFWSTLLFRTKNYSGNAFRPHMEMPELTGDKFAFWVATLESVVDARFAGPTASQMKELAHRIAYSMQLRLGIYPFEPFHTSA
jgi:hemoglobin